ncbi:S8 family serine peptidase [Clostridium sp. JNZ J1-5]
MKRFAAYLILIMLTILAGCNNKDLTKEVITAKNSEMISITRHPELYNLNIEKLSELPHFDKDSTKGEEIDLRGKDLSELPLKNRADDLMYSQFNMSTKWPSELPENFNPQIIMKNGKNPGLNIRELHGEGVTGKGIGIAIIDAPLLVDHIEYKDNLKVYEEIDLVSSNAYYHGPLVASLAVGKSVGVAPEADLFFIATKNTDNDGTINLNSFAKSIDRILEINKKLPKESKIRVISISAGWIQGQKGYEEIKEAISRAKQEGIFVVSSMLVGEYGYFFDGLGRDPMSDPDSIYSYEPNVMYNDYYFNEEDIYKFFKERTLKKFKLEREIKNVLYVPMDSRSFASLYSNEDYIFGRINGWSMCSPYIAGLYALTCQVYPKTTPDLFWKTALETGDSITVNKYNKQIVMEKIVNPKRLIDKMKSYKK